MTDQLHRELLSSVHGFTTHATAMLVPVLTSGKAVATFRVSKWTPARSRTAGAGAAKAKAAGPFHMARAVDDILIGVVPPDAHLSANHHHADGAGRFLRLHNGTLCGSGKQEDDHQPDFCFREHDTITVVVDLRPGNGSVLFFHNGRQCGPGYTSGVEPPLCFCVMLPETLVLGHGEVSVCGVRVVPTLLYTVKTTESNPRHRHKLPIPIHFAAVSRNDAQTAKPIRRNTPRDPPIHRYTTPCRTKRRRA